MTAFSVFHRVQQDSATSRDLMFQIDDAMNIITEAVKENKIDYFYYDCAESDSVKTAAVLNPGVIQSVNIRQDIICSDDSINPNSLYLTSLDGSEEIIFKWDSSERSLTMQKVPRDLDGVFVELDEPAKLQSDLVKVSYVDFRIFPALDPYDFRNNETEDFYQPNVKVKMTFETPVRRSPSFL